VLMECKAGFPKPITKAENIVFHRWAFFCKFCVFCGKN